MAQRISIKDLRILVDRLNHVTGSPMQPWENGKANIGNYHLYEAYGSIGLHRMFNEGGGVTTVFHLGTKRELYLQMHSFLAGLQEGKA